MPTQKGLVDSVWSYNDNIVPTALVSGCHDNMEMTELKEGSHGCGHSQCCHGDSTQVPMEGRHGDSISETTYILWSVTACVGIWSG
jgi:hypothetical protein